MTWGEHGSADPFNLFSMAVCVYESGAGYVLVRVKGLMCSLVEAEVNFGFLL